MTTVETEATNPHPHPHPHSHQLKHLGASTRLVSAFKNAFHIHHDHGHEPQQHPHHDPNPEHLKRLMHKHKWEQVLQWLEEEHDTATATATAKEVPTEPPKDTAVNNNEESSPTYEVYAAADKDKNEESASAPSLVMVKENALHLMCQFHPPFRVVSKTLKLMPHLVHQLNEEKKSPLHVAAAYGASPKVVHLLIKYFPLAVSWQDTRGRTPLHCHLYECSNKKLKFNCDMGYLYEETEEGGVQDANLVQGPLMEVLKELCKYMTSEEMGLQDKFGRIPLEIAKYYECEVTTLAVIKEAM
jgi:hypothetical protein